MSDTEKVVRVFQLPLQFGCSIAEIPDAPDQKIAVYFDDAVYALSVDNARKLAAFIAAVCNKVGS